MIEYQGKPPQVKPVYCPHCGSRLASFTRFTYGNIELRNIDEVFFEGERIELSRNQYLIVDALVRAKGRLVDRSLLAMAIGGDVFDNTITANVKRTRDTFRKVYPKFDQIQNARGFGAYRWVHQKASSGQARRLVEHGGGISQVDALTRL